MRYTEARNRTVARYLAGLRRVRFKPDLRDVSYGTRLTMTETQRALDALRRRELVRAISPDRRHTIVRYELTRAGRVWLTES